MPRKTITGIAILSVVLGGLSWYLFKSETPDISTFEECAKYYPIMESYPARCTTLDGDSFTEDIGNEFEKQDLIQTDTPRPNTIISSPLTITGRARGIWFFEASFPIELRDESGNLLVQHYAEAEGEWMTADFVPFRSTLTFTKPAGGTKGTLILRKDNPSGLPEHEDALIIPIRF